MVAAHHEAYRALKGRQILSMHAAECSVGTAVGSAASV